jgi:membrane associated rhomboid family serine protease
MKAARPPTGERVRRWNARNQLLITKTIIAVNVVLFLGTSSSAQFKFDLALIGPLVQSGEWWRLITSGFLHFNVIHILFNMLILYRFGEMLEPALGKTRMVALYFAALLAGSFGAVLVEPGAATGGASGAVFGLLGAAAVGLRQRGISVWQSGVGGLILVNLVLTFAVPGISIGGHVGGLIGGAAAGAAMLRHDRPTRSTLAVDLAAAIAVGALAFIGGIAAAHRSY